MQITMIAVCTRMPISEMHRYMCLEWSIILQCGLSVGKLNLVSILVYVVYTSFQGNLMYISVNSMHMYIKFFSLLTHKYGDEVSLFSYIHIGR